MEILNLKDSVEKDTFFLKLPNLAEQLPHPIVLKKLVSLLASALEFGSAAAPTLAALLKMGSLAFDKRIQFQGHALSVPLQYPDFQMLIFVL
uniref:Uncharacterized protein n=1 Tax=Quercus lobata TaxID=97700 RepID=A0A7N2LTR1_QUELO